MKGNVGGTLGFIIQGTTDPRPLTTTDTGALLVSSSGILTVKSVVGGSCSFGRQLASVVYFSRRITMQ